MHPISDFFWSMIYTTGKKKNIQKPLKRPRIRTYLYNLYAWNLGLECEVWETPSNLQSPNSVEKGCINMKLQKKLD